MNLKKLSLRGQEGPWKDNQGKSAVFISLSRPGLGISETAENSHVTPTPMPSQDNCCSIWTPFPPGLPRCGFLHREERTGTLPPAVRGEVMPPTPLPVLGCARVPSKCLAPCSQASPGPQAPPGLWHVFTRLLGQPTPAQGVCSPLQNLGGSQDGAGGLHGCPKERGHCHCAGLDATPPSDQFTHSFTELAHQSVSRASGDPERGHRTPAH